MIGQTISHYKILEKLGEGGMGVVYKAEDTKLDRTVALKFLSPQAVDNEEEKTRFLHEAKAAAALNHPNICTVYEIDETEKQLFIAMEYIAGRSLEDLIETGPLNLKEARDIAMQIAEGLHEAHRGQIVHRDIKPANIMITDEGRVKIMDFGLAKSSGRTKLTKEGTTLGTVAYMSPEQTRSEEVDHRTDLWSVGVILYEMVSGQLPFKGDHEQAVIYSIVNEDPRQLTSLRTAVPLVLERITYKAMAKDKKDRYQHADELLVDLRSLKEEIDSASMTTGSVKRGFRRRHLSLVFVIAIVIAAAFVLARLYLIPEKDKTIDSIAVLPLENLSGDPGQDYFADGMTEALIADLATMGSLKVISRTSVMRYKESRKPLPEIARELNVDAIVEGSILQISGRVRITAQLIEAVSDRHLWAESYERDMRDILALQRDVAHAIAREINIELAPREMADSTGARQVDPQAYEAYLMGRFFWNKRTKENLEKSIEFFERALARDPGYALAYIGLADAYLILSDWAYRPPKECYPRAKELVMKALEIDEYLAEAHNTLAYITGIYEWRWGEAEAGFKRAIQLNPNYATAHQWYAEYLCILGRFDEAIQKAQKAQELDPLLAAVHYIAGISFYYAGQFDRAIEQCEKAIVINEDFNGALFYMAQSFKEQGRQEKAFEGYLKTLLVCGLSEEKIPDLRSIFNTSGINGYFRWFIDDGYEQLKGPDVIEYHFLLSSAYLGETDLVFEVLERYVQERRRTIVEVGVEPAFNGLRSDPRFEKILRRIGLGQ